MINQRLLDSILCLAVTSLLVAGLYIELGLGVQPCLLCLLQRIAWLGLWICFFLLVLLNWPRWFRFVIEGISFVCAILGMSLAGRQAWLQMMEAHSPNSHLACLPNAYFLIQHTALPQVMQMALAGTDDCALVHWTFGGISLAWWSLTAFIIIACVLMVRWLIRHFN